MKYSHWRAKSPKVPTRRTSYWTTQMRAVDGRRGACLAWGTRSRLLHSRWVAYPREALSVGK